MTTKLPFNPCTLPLLDKTFGLRMVRDLPYIETTVGDYLLTGEPDELIASGYHEPETPFFAFAEYKRQRDPNGDPAGQALAAMLVGQTLNGDQHPVYGPMS